MYDTFHLLNNENAMVLPVVRGVPLGKPPETHLFDVSLLVTAWGDGGEEMPVMAGPVHDQVMKAVSTAFHSFIVNSSALNLDFRRFSETMVAELNDTIGAHGDWIFRRILLIGLISADLAARPPGAVLH